MSRVFAITLALSTAAHLAAVGFGPSSAPPQPTARAALALTLVAAPIPPAAQANAASNVTAAVTQPAPQPRLEQRIAADKPIAMPRPSTTHMTKQAPNITSVPSTVARPSTQFAKPATAASFTPVDQPQNDAPSDALMQQIQSLLSGRFHYPRLARKHGWEGIVEIALDLAPNGNITQVQLHRASGHAVLDNAALHSAQQLHTIPNATALLQGRTRAMIIPIHYRLLES